MIRHLFKRSRILPLSSIRQASAQTVGAAGATPEGNTPDPPRRPLEETKEEKTIGKMYEHIPKTGSKYLRGLRFKKFVDKMEQLYLKERKWQLDNEARAREFMAASLASATPIHDVFKHYHRRSAREFAGRNIVMCLKSIGDVLRVRGPSPVHHFDYSQEQLLDSWQLYHLIEDVQFALKLSSLVIPRDISKVFQLNRD